MRKLRKQRRLLLIKSFEDVFPNNNTDQILFSRIVVVNEDFISCGLDLDLSTSCIMCSWMSFCISAGSSGASWYSWFRRCPWATRYHSDASSKSCCFPHAHWAVFFYFPSNTVHPSSQALARELTSFCTFTSLHQQQAKGSQPYFLWVTNHLPCKCQPVQWSGTSD